MALANALTDFFTKTGRHEPAGGDFRDIVRGVESPENDAYYAQQILEPGPNVVQMQPKSDRPNMRKILDEIPKLSVDISGLQNQIDELELEKCSKIERRRTLRQEVLKEADRLGCFEEIEGHANTPPAIPTET